MAKQEARLVDPNSRNSAYFEKIRSFFNRALLHPWPYAIVRMALAALFIYAGVIKLFDPGAFAATISTYDLVPEPLLPLLALGLPLVETVAGLALILNKPWGLHLVAGLLTLFIFVLGYAIIGNLDVDCGCFGASELEKQAGLQAAFYRDLILIGLVMPYLYIGRRVRELARSVEEK